MKNDMRNIMIAFIICCTALNTACQSDDVRIPDDGRTELKNVKRGLGKEQLISLAVCRTFDGQDVSLKSDFRDIKEALFSPAIRLMSDDQAGPNIRYEFDYIEIGNALQYTVDGIDFPLLNEICGKGPIEVFLAAFNTYVYAGEAENEKYLTPHISDALIMFKSELGIYACLNNGGSSVSGIEESEYSSHKRLGQNAVEKDFTPPVYKFYVKTEQHQKSLAYKVEIDENGILQNLPLKWVKLYEVAHSDSENIFSVNELCVLPETSQQCMITEIGKDYFLVSGQYNLQKICFDDNTLFVSGELPSRVADLAKGDVITVTFDQLYEKYNPKVVMVNKITHKL